jgi:hypothetical protein
VLIDKIPFKFDSAGSLRNPASMGEFVFIAESRKREAEKQKAKS